MKKEDLIRRINYQLKSKGRKLVLSTTKREVAVYGKGSYFISEKSTGYFVRELRSDEALVAYARRNDVIEQTEHLDLENS